MLDEPHIGGVLQVCDPPGYTAHVVVEDGQPDMLRLHHLLVVVVNS